MFCDTTATDTGLLILGFLLVRKDDWYALMFFGMDGLPAEAVADATMMRPGCDTNILPVSMREGSP